MFKLPLTLDVANQIDHEVLNQELIFVREIGGSTYCGIVQYNSHTKTYRIAFGSGKKEGIPYKSIHELITHEKLYNFFI